MTKVRNSLALTKTLLDPHYCLYHPQESLTTIIVSGDAALSKEKPWKRFRRLTSQCVSTVTHYSTQGTHQLQKIEGVPFHRRPVPIIRYGSPVNHPVLLNGEGLEARPNDKGIVVPAFRKFRSFHAQPFKPIIERGIFGGL